MAAASERRVLGDGGKSRASNPMVVPTAGVLSNCVMARRYSMAAASALPDLLPRMS